MPEGALKRGALIIELFCAPVTPRVLVKGRNQMRGTGKKKKSLEGLRREEFFVPIVVILSSISYISQVWGAPRVVILWPYIVMVLLLVCTAVVVGESLAGGWRRVQKKDSSSAGILAWLRKGEKPLLITGITICYLVAIEHLGFTLSNFLYLMILLRVLGTRSVMVITCISLLITAVLHLVMINFLQMPIPRLHLPFTSWEL
ncbi:MAG: tripartite tricarboxylate transporter TctB family protein [Deltaproteobacteria bacterium]|nr:tripartite tricarboxylate transporter TctB family protein [Deltaproteobacteria bacterium]